jgi:hypothetical protein
MYLDNLYKSRFELNELLLYIFVQCLKRTFIEINGTFETFTYLVFRWITFCGKSSSKTKTKVIDKLKMSWRKEFVCEFSITGSFVWKMRTENGRERERERDGKIEGERARGKERKRETEVEWRKSTNKWKTNLEAPVKDRD